MTTKMPKLFQVLATLIIVNNIIKVLKDLQYDLKMRVITLLKKFHCSTFKNIIFFNFFNIYLKYCFFFNFANKQYGPQYCSFCF